MKLPRNVSGKVGYKVTRQTGSHMRLTTTERGEHHVTIPRHDPLRLGTLSAILFDVAKHFEMDKAALVQELFGG